jgi:hypothetical protein
MPAGTTDPTVVRQGILPGYAGGTRLGVVPTSPSPTMAVTVAGGPGVVSRAGQGPYICAVDAAVNVDIAAANATNPRIDIVILRTYDLDLGDVAPAGITLPSGQRGCATVEVVGGTPAGSPAAPATPANAIKIAEVTVPANATSIVAGNIAQHRTAAALRGGVRTLLEDDLTTAAGIYDGEMRWVTSSALPLQAWSDGLGQWRGIGGGATYQTTTVSALSNQTSDAQLTSLSIPDPGVPYRLQVTGSAEITAVVGTRADIWVTLDTVGGPGMAAGRNSSEQGNWVVTYAGQSGELTGAHTVILKGARAYGTGAWATTTNFGYLGVRLLPAP